ncbi:hypothetical protein HDU85_002157 [Gaertneriomyces sp. JEL0708]|nr:hypothetical protein HDU85_002157 [Gaertneriomyces sp. JEL0708]
MSRLGYIVNCLVLTGAVSAPTWVSYYYTRTVPDLWTLFLASVIALIVYNVLDIPRIIDEVCGVAAIEDIPKTLDGYGLESAVPKELSMDSLYSEHDGPGNKLQHDTHDHDNEFDESPPINDPYIADFPALESELLSLADTSLSPASPNGDEWHTVLSQTWGRFKIDIHKRVGRDFFYRYVMELCGTPEETFDLLSDITKRPQWDELCEEGGTVEKVSGTTTVQYFRTKGMWPTKPRCALVVGFVKDLGERRYLNVTKSIDSHPQFAFRKGDVVMNARIAGQIVEPDREGRPRMCRVVQLLDGDLGGYLPGSILNLVTTKAIPIGMRKVNKALKSIEEQRTVSEFITAAAAELRTRGKVKVVDGLKSVEDNAADLKSPANPPSKSVNSNNQRTSSTTIIRQSVSDRGILMAKPTALRVILSILRRSQPWVIVSILLALVTGRFKR